MADSAKELTLFRSKTDGSLVCIPDSTYKDITDTLLAKRFVDLKLKKAESCFQKVDSLAMINSRMEDNYKQIDIDREKQLLLKDSTIQGLTKTIADNQWKSWGYSSIAVVIGLVIGMLIK